MYPTLRPIVFGLDLPITIRRENIAQRLKQRLQHGLIEEVQQLRAIISDDQLEYYGLEYKFVTWHLQGKISFMELQQKLTTAIQQFAKRQMTYFRKMERDGLPIHWMNATLPINEQIELAKQFIELKSD
jgi:tRNA dimethylallyltransferase